MAKTFVLECPIQCSLGPNSRHGVQVTQWMLDGRTYKWICNEVKDLFDIKLYPANMSRHKPHIVVTGRDADPDIDAGSAHKANNIEILEDDHPEGLPEREELEADDLGHDEGHGHVVPAHAGQPVR